MRGFAWYLKRLKVMTPAEIAWRLLEAIKLKMLEAAFRSTILERRYANDDSESFEFCTDPKPQLPPVPFRLDAKHDEIASWLNGAWLALGFDWSWSPDPDIWHRAPDIGHDWPQVFFSKITYRQGNPFGDARVVWEPSRLQQLVTLALIACRHEETRIQAVDLITRQLLSWHRANPIACGMHYVSAMECALRILAVCLALDLIRQEIRDRPDLWRCATVIVHSHADLILHRLSLHSSAGNHTIAESAGLIFAGILFSEHRRAGRWYEVGLKTLRREAARQILPDGGGIERATWYHLFVLDLIGLVERLLVFKGHEVPAELTTALKRGRAFLTALASSPTDLPILGDADAGYALSPFLRLSFEEPTPRERLTTLPDTGLTLVRPASQSGLTLIFDHGPLGMPPSYGHGHADALSLILYDDSGPLLIDPGTYTYTGDQRWRNYFRGTRAHNTVLVDGLDQARPETPFMWSRPFAAELLEAETLEQGQIRLLARQTGYRDLGILHWRGVLISPDVLIVWDGIRGSGTHRFELNWHLGVDAVQHSANLLHLVRPANQAHGEISLRLNGGAVSLHQGDLDPILGWRSTLYGRKSAITTISLRHQGHAPHEFLSIFSFTETEPESSDIETVVDWFRQRAV